MADSKKYNGSTWEHSLRKLTTATEAVENPLYSDGTAITSYTISGNTVQNGTPTPSNPVDVNGVGERTENLLKNDAISTEFRGVQYTVNADKSITVYGTASSQISYFILMGDGAATNDLSAYTTPIFKAGDTLKFSSGSSIYKLCGRNTNGTYLAVLDGTVTLSKDLGLIYIQVLVGATADETIYPMITLATETDTDYEPYGYKIPILNGQQTIDIYIGDLPLLKSLDGTAFDEISNGTLTRRVDSDGSVLPTPTTTQITTPSIPTIEGANSITVDTTVQPSEFTATWTGWHNASVREWNGSDWQ